MSCCCRVGEIVLGTRREERRLIYCGESDCLAKDFEFTANGLWPHRSAVTIKKKGV